MAEVGTVNLWLGELTGVDEQPYWLLLDHAERQRAEQFSNQPRRMAYIETRARLRLMLGLITQSPPEKLRIAQGVHGKPYLPEYPELAFNLSHTGNQLAIATGQHCLLGVDIETIKPRFTLSALVEKCFTETEQAYWRQLPEHAQTRAFYRFWVQKEAFVKAVGKGIALGLDKVVTDPFNQGKLLKIPPAYGKPEEWQLHDFDISPEVCGALAVNAGIIPNSISLVVGRIAKI